MEGIDRFAFVGTSYLFKIFGIRIGAGSALHSNVALEPPIR
jgi:hypothetical protein